MEGCILRYEGPLLVAFLRVLNLTVAEAGGGSVISASCDNALLWLSRGTGDSFMRWLANDLNGAAENNDIEFFPEYRADEFV